MFHPKVKEIVDENGFAVIKHHGIAFKFIKVNIFHWSF